MFDKPVKNEWGRLDVETLKKSGFIIETLHGKINETDIVIMCFYSSMGNRKPIVGDILFDFKTGKRVSIFSLPTNEDETYRFIWNDNE